MTSTLMADVAVAPLSADEGVYYDRKDHPGFFRRLAVDVVDLVVLLVISGVYLHVAFALVQHEPIRPWIPLGVFMVWWLYLVPLKQSRLGTPGYFLFRVKVVNLHGQTPSLWRLTLRAGITIAFNGLNAVVDLVYLTVDGSRQAIRDKLSGTYVVSRRAVPVGRGRLVYNRIFFIMFAILYREVVRPG